MHLCIALLTLNLYKSGGGGFLSQKVSSYLGPLKFPAALYVFQWLNPFISFIDRAQQMGIAPIISVFSFVDTSIIEVVFLFSFHVDNMTTIRTSLHKTTPLFLGGPFLQD